MNEITKVSDITAQDVLDYLRVDDATEEVMATNLLNVAKSFMVNYTGRTEEELDNYPDFVIVVFVLCQDMYDTRSLYVEKNNLNKVVETILGMHATNYLPNAEANQ